MFLGPTGEAYGLKDLYSSLNSGCLQGGHFAGSNSIYRRSAKMYLIEAEVYAHGATGDANSILTELVKTRNPAFVSPGGGDTLTESYYKEE